MRFVVESCYTENPAWYICLLIVLLFLLLRLSSTEEGDDLHLADADTSVYGQSVLSASHFQHMARFSPTPVQLLKSNVDAIHDQSPRCWITPMTMWNRRFALAHLARSLSPVLLILQMGPHRAGESDKKEVSCTAMTNESDPRSIPMCTDLGTRIGKAVFLKGMPAICGGE